MRYSISVNSYSIVADKFVHNEIVFKDAGTNEIFHLNGGSFDKEDGGNIEFSFLSDDDTLRAFLSDQSFNTRNEGMGEPLHSEVLFASDDGRAFQEKFVKALEAGVFINSQGLDYVPFNICEKEQNSNSVAATVLHVMELEYDASDHGFIAPGDDDLLWAEELREESFYEQIDIIPADFHAHVLDRHQDNLLFSISEETIGHTIRSENSMQNISDEPSGILAKLKEIFEDVSTRFRSTAEFFNPSTAIPSVVRVSHAVQGSFAEYAARESAHDQS
ncbi:MAG: hypothetical protein COB36_01150 [Alphaproteobacteria bacterium]|nr:MAG: hypothetical protein COB36_01150 [Alphaproteobacteria bacterium]